MWDRKIAHEQLGRNVLFAGGNVQWVSEDEFTAILLKYRIDESKCLLNAPDSGVTQALRHDSAPASRERLP
jgi:hypothetical protein